MGKWVADCNSRADVPSWVDEDKEAQKRVWDLIAKEIEIAAPGSLAKVLG